MTISPAAPRTRRLSKGHHHQEKKIKDGKDIDIGKPLGEFDTASVREKVRKWQTQGGGVVTAEDAEEDKEVLGKKSPRWRNGDGCDDIRPNDDDLHRRSAPYADRNRGFSPGPSPSSSTSHMRGSGQDGTRLSEKKKTQAHPAKLRHNDLDEDVKNASAPKKRVVSDSRWRKTQVHSSRKDGSPQRESAQERPTSRAGRQLVSPSSKATPRKPQRSLSSSRYATANDKTNDGKESTKRETSNHELASYPDLNNKRRHRRRSSAVAPETLQADKHENVATPSQTWNYATQKTPKSSSSRKQNKEKVGHDEKKYVMSGALNFSSPSEKEPNLDPFAIIDHEGGVELGAPILHPPKRAETPTRPPSNRIEAWLTSTPDPFTEPSQVGIDSVKQDLNRHAGPTDSSVSRTKRRDSRENKITSNDDPQTSRIRHERSYSSEDGRRKRPKSARGAGKGMDQNIEVKDNMAQSLNGDSPTPSPTTLKRRGARRKMQQASKSRSPEQLDGAREPFDGSNMGAPSAFTSSTNESGEVEGLSMDDLMMRRPFPTTGKRLSTIVSVATQNTNGQGISPSVASVDTQITERPHRKPVSSTAQKKPDTLSATPGTTATKKTSLKRKLTTHADLMSVLSIPREECGSIISARSIRTSRTRLATATVDDLMKEVASDEAKYTRELRTLVDGVIPVLLSCVLSKTESATAAGLFSRSPSSSGASVTRPIVDMGVALERLKSVHKRIPTGSSEQFLAWTQTAKKIYADYIKAWRLGFQDVVVNLAPATDVGHADGAAWDEGLSRNDDGYLIGGDGERVDVAFLLKRPLVRLKYLSKTVKGINTLKPSAAAERLTSEYLDLVAEARNKSNQEKARLEDEAAAAIDPTRARDPRTLAALADVAIHPKRCVRARDYFDLHFPHSSGQLIDCKVEILLRDNPASEGEGGDALLCEVSSNEKWLLLPPISLDSVSAKQCSGGITVQIRGIQTSGKEWSEVFNLYCDDTDACLEWVEMLGSVPEPRDCLATNKFDMKSSKTAVSLNSSVSSGYDSTKVSSAFTGSTPPSPRTVEIPIGEQASKPRASLAPPTSRNERRRSSPLSTSSVSRTYDEPPPRVKRKSVQILEPYPNMSPSAKPKDSWWSLSTKLFGASTGKPDADVSPKERSKHHENERLRNERSRQHLHDSYSRRPQDFNATPPSADRKSHPGKLQKSREGGALRPHSIDGTETSSPPSKPNVTGKGYSVWLPHNGESRDDDDEDEKSDEDADDMKHPSRSSYSQPARPNMTRRTSSVPSEELPSIPRIRKSTHESPKDHPTTPSTPKSTPVIHPKSVPNSAPAVLQKKPPPDRTSKQVDHRPAEIPPVPPAHKSPISSFKKSPPATLKLSSPLSSAKNNRRTSSPLKHEYEPSTATDTSSESDVSGSEDETESSRSDESDEDELANDVRKPEIHQAKVEAQQTKVSPPESLFSLPNVTISPSQSASQSPYRAVAPQPSQANKTIASIFAWSQKGLWENLHPDECSIVITPGLIEAFEMSSEHSRSAASQIGGDSAAPRAVRPLIALELTPLVPIRRGTALDISIRSPPTANSKIRSGNNVMFRSRTAEECSALYHLINNSRINNPTYIALQNARGPYGDPSMGGGMDRRNSMRGMKGGGANGSGWWASHFGSSSRSYRASTRAPSIQTDSSVGTMATAFSALKRFSGPGRLFNIAHSTVSSRMHSSASSLEGSSSSGIRTPPNGIGRSSFSSPARNVAASMITNTKIRLYQRETQSKWRDMGAARLTITNPVRPANSTSAGQSSIAGSTSNSSSGATSAIAPLPTTTPGPPRQEKRIIATGKTKGEVLLDVTLGESCFERVARTGIAVSVWEENVGPNGEIGQVGAVGGVGARARVYMIQMKTERECAYCFSLLGKLRY